MCKCQGLEKYVCGKGIMEDFEGVKWFSERKANLSFFFFAYLLS
jgi:hypothetical protein